MRRILWIGLGALLVLNLAACHEFSDDNAVVVGDTTCVANDVKANEGEAADLGCVKVTILKSDFSASQLNVTARMENKSDKPFTLKTSAFTALDSSQSEGLPTTCGGKGGFSGELAGGEKLEGDICWFLVGGTPPLTIKFALPGRGSALITLNVK